MSYIPDVRGTERDGQLHQQEMRDKAALHELAIEAKRDGKDGDSKRASLRERLLARLRRSDP
jgi:hypothetical protein